MTHYDALAGSYDDRYTGARGRYFDALETQPVLALAPDDVTSALDLGTGTGRILAAIEARWPAARVVGCDLSLGMLAQAEGRDVVAADATASPFPSDAFDFVTAVGTFEYVNDLRPFLAECHRVLAPGGRLVFTAHHAEPLLRVRGNGQPARHTVGGIRRQLRATGFDLAAIESTFYANELVRLADRAGRRLPGVPTRLLIWPTIPVQRWLSGWTPTQLGGRELIVAADSRARA